jgi:hypothetical protein
MNASASDSGLLDQKRLDVVKRQRFQDFLFHKITLSFSLLVLAALAGILISSSSGVSSGTSLMRSLVLQSPFSAP